VDSVLHFRFETLKEPSLSRCAVPKIPNHSPGLIHRSLFALCNRSKSPATRLITTQNGNSVS